MKSRFGLTIAAAVTSMICLTACAPDAPPTYKVHKVESSAASQDASEIEKASPFQCPEVPNLKSTTPITGDKKIDYSTCTNPSDPMTFMVQTIAEPIDSICVFPLNFVDRKTIHFIEDVRNENMPDPHLSHLPGQDPLYSCGEFSLDPNSLEGAYAAIYSFKSIKFNGALVVKEQFRGLMSFCLKSKNYDDCASFAYAFGKLK